MSPFWRASEEWSMSALRLTLPVSVEVIQLGFVSALQPNEALRESIHGKIRDQSDDNPKRVQAMLNSLQDVQDGVASFQNQASTGSLLRTCFEDPSEWCDNRKNKLHPESPDFKHRSTSQGFWEDSLPAPQWSGEALNRKAPSRKAGGDTLGRNTCSGKHRTGNVLDFKRSRWTAQISELAKSGQGKQALRFYREMRDSGVTPCSRTFVAALKACSSLQDLESTKRIHAEVLESGFQSDVFVGTMLVNVYAKCGSLVDARRVFEEIPVRNVVCWTAMIVGYAQMEEGNLALQLYARMRQDGVVPNDRTFVGALKACSSLAAPKGGHKGDGSAVKRWCLEHVLAIHAHIVKTDFESDVFVGNMLVDVYAKCGSIVDARLVFDNMRCRNVVSWTAMIVGYANMDEGDQALQMYTLMLQDGVEPNERTYIGALKACSSLAILEQGDQADGIPLKKQTLEQVRTIHSRLAAGGFESQLFVATMLLDVYAKCGSLGDARSIFARIPNRNVVSWNAMILGHAQMGDGEEALQLYAKMKQEGVVPDDRTFVGVLKACGNLAAYEAGNGSDWIPAEKSCLAQVRAIHSDGVRNGRELAVFVTTTLVDVYVKCGSLVDARLVFEGMPHRDVVAWNAMISGYAQMEQGEEALELYARMQREGVVANYQTLACALKACCNLAAWKTKKKDNGIVVNQWCLEQVRAIHLEVVKGNFELDVVLGNMLVDVYVKSGSLVDAMHVFETMPSRNVGSWTAIILGCTQLQKSELTLKLYTQMQREKVVPNKVTFIGALKACSSLALVDSGNENERMLVKKRCLEQVRTIHSDIENSGYGSSVIVETMLVDVYAKCGSLVDARLVFEKMPCRDVVSWNAMIAGYSQIEAGEEALQLYARMKQEGNVPDDRTFVAALKACSSLALSEQGNLSDTASAEKNRALVHIRAIHSEAVKGGFETDIFVGNMLVDAYAKCRSLVDSRQVFEAMSCRDVVSWTAMIMAYAQVEDGELGLQLYARMQQEGVVPNDRTFVAALMACGSVAALEKGKEVHAQISNIGLEVTHSHVASSIIDMYGKCGSMGNAQQVFDTLPIKHVVTWSALIAGYARQGESEVVFQLFERMRQDGVKPNAITFLGLLTVCSHAGLVDRGQKYLELMSRDFGISPSIEHYNCIVDLLARAGQMDKAMEMVKNMPFHPRAEVWRCLLAACQKWKFVELGRHAFENAVRLDTTDTTAYLLMSNIYAAAHMWEDVKEIQATRLRTRARKHPGKSWWLGEGENVHAFLSLDQEDADRLPVYGQLLDLSLKMQDEGNTYITDASLEYGQDDAIV